MKCDVYMLDNIENKSITVSFITNNKKFINLIFKKIYIIKFFFFFFRNISNELVLPLYIEEALKLNTQLKKINSFDSVKIFFIKFFNIINKIINKFCINKK